MPTFSITAEEIFADEILLLDVNFFDPKPSKTITTTKSETITSLPSDYYAFIKVYCGATTDYVATGGWHDNNPADGIDGYELIYDEDMIQDYRGYHDLAHAMFPDVFQTRGSFYTPSLSQIYDHTLIKDYPARKSLLESIMTKTNDALTLKGKRNIIPAMQAEGLHCESIGWSEAAWDGRGQDSYHTLDPAYFLGRMSFNASTSETPLYVVITFGVKYTDIDNTEHREIVTTETEIVTLHSTAEKLAGVISKWYFILRNIALLVLMLLLIYSGIRIVIGSTAGEKAKYKERLKDWLVAICLIFVMHYIMVFAVKLVEKITELVRDAAGLNGNAAYIQLTDEQYKSIKDIIESDKYDISNIGDIVTEDDGGHALTWKTDLAGLFRIQSQLTGEGTAKWVGFSLCYVVLVLFTLFFAWTYLKRVLYMAFLTMIAPLVAMTYPIDKITDGKAQAFDAWLKEYIFNLMIQPLHLLLYAILVSSAYELATSSPLYALVAIGFMMPAEKLMRRFFGFEKAKTPGLLGGAAGAALAMSGLQSLMKHKPHGGKPEGGNSKEQNKVKFANKNNINTMGAVAGGAAPTLTAGGGSSSGDSSGDGAGTNPIRQQPSQHSEGGNNPSPLGENHAIDDYDIDEEEILRNTTLWDDEFSQSGEENPPAPADSPEGDTNNIPPISTFAKTNAARAAYNRTRSFDEERAANIARNREKRKQRIKGATGAVLTSAGRQIAAGAIRGIHPLKWAGRIATGATAATAGLLLGVASGDPTKALQYTTAGAVAGNALAKSFSGAQVLDAQKLKEEAEIGYYGEDYKKKVIEDQRKVFQKDASNINYLRQTMGVGKEEAKEILATTGGQCFDNGITSIEDIATIHKLTNGEDSLSFNQAVAARNYAKKRLPSDPDQMTEDTKAEYIKRWKHEYQRAGYANAGDLANKSFDLAIRFNKAQSGLTKNP